MSEYPDFSEHGYRIEQILGSHPTGGRVTYRAIALKTRLPVVIKQYQFAQPGTSWIGYRAYESEIRVLRSLYSDNVPRYLDSFETKTGFCLVQEYKSAPALSPAYVFDPETIKQIAIAILDVLVHLQSQNPPVIHGDLKPDNILFDPQTLKIYLVDFGFARMGSGDVTISSVVKGTVGFMPPEEMFNRQLTKASDLYSLGATLICLLTRQPATEINHLIDENTNRLNFKPHLPPLHPQFVQWLEKMVAPSTSDRFPNAAAALRVLQTTPITPPQSWLAAPPGKNLRSTWLIRIGTVAALALLAGLGITYWQGKDARQLLSSKACPNCNLASLSLTNGDLTQANLAGANLQDASLRGANLTKANLKGANLQNAYLKDINLTHANLEGANLSGSNLNGANLASANLEGANLEGASLEDANLTNANLKYANLVDSKLRFSRLNSANLEGSNLGGTNLEGVSLKGATMPNGQINN